MIYVVAYMCDAAELTMVHINGNSDPEVGQDTADVGVLYWLDLNGVTGWRHCFSRGIDLELAIGGIVLLPLLLFIYQCLL